MATKTKQTRKTPVRDLTFRRFQAMNAMRCKVAFPTCADWTLQDWGCSLAGEVGELCNMLKKLRRGDFTLKILRKKILAELADIITCADLMTTELEASTGDELLEKFGEVSRRVGYHGSPGCRAR